MIQPAGRAAHGVVGRSNGLGTDVEGIVGSSRSIEGHGWVQGWVEQMKHRWSC